MERKIVNSYDVTQKAMRVKPGPFVKVNYIECRPFCGHSVIILIDIHSKVKQV